MTKKFGLMVIFLMVSWSAVFGQNSGSLFIIGGGERTPSLMQEMVKTANLHTNDYIVILPMATSVPEESIALLKKQLGDFSTQQVTSFNFTREQADQNQVWIDSVRNGKLIYITGGDQNKFMKVVSGTKLYDALHDAFRNGATLAGTSAGAAVMSEIMITGEEKELAGKQIKANNVITTQGMGFLTTAIIDQHFIKRSRYNRLLSILGDYPEMTVIGIDESTAIIVHKSRARVVGSSQVVVISKPKKKRVLNNGLIDFYDAKLSVLSHGQRFKLMKNIK